MRKNNKSSFVIGILICIIIILVVVIGLFATNTISFGNKVNSDDRQTTNNEDNINEEEKENDDSNNLDNERYSSIIEEYKKAMNDIGYNDNMDVEKNYPNINEYMMHYYHGGSASFSYVFYDINKDGKNEMIVGDGSNGIYEMYTYDGSKAIKFYNQSCLGDRCNSSIYDNGIIYFYGSGGASVHGLDFYKIGDDGYSKDTFKSYSVEYDSNGNVTITDELTKTTTNYKTDDEVINDVVGSSKKIDLSKLDWIVIK